MRGTLDVLGLFDCPVGIGTDGGEGGRSYTDTFSQTARSYMSPPHAQRTYELLPGRKLLYNTFEEAAPRSITMCLISSP